MAKPTDGAAVELHHLTQRLAALGRATKPDAEAVPRHEAGAILRRAYDLGAFRAPGDAPIANAVANAPTEIRSDADRKAAKGAWYGAAANLYASGIIRPSVKPDQPGREAYGIPHPDFMRECVAFAGIIAASVPPMNTDEALILLNTRASWRFTELPSGVTLEVLRALDADGFIEVHSWGRHPKCNERGYPVGGFEYTPLGVGWFSPTANPLRGGSWGVIARKAMEDPQLAVGIRVSERGKAALARRAIESLGASDNNDDHSRPPALSAGADDSAGPALTVNQSRVLQTMAIFDASRLVSADAIAAEMAPAGRLSARTIGPIVRRLIELCLAERPEGDRSGARLTTAGRRLAQKIAD